MTDRTVTWIVGATSGIGRAAAYALAGPNRHLVLSARRADLLADVVRDIESAGFTAVAEPLDVSDAAAVDRVAARIATQQGPPTEVMFCAGKNVPHRSWADLDPDEADAVIAVNLSSVARGVARVLPAMRAHGYGRVVIVSSWAGWTYGRGAGVAYSASKTALRSLTDSLNDQEGPHGISACLLCPGDVNTPLIDNRPVAPTAAQRAAMLTPEDIAGIARIVFDLPQHVSIPELVVSPIGSHSYGR